LSKVQIRLCVVRLWCRLGVLAISHTGEHESGHSRCAPNFLFFNLFTNYTDRTTRRGDGEGLNPPHSFSTSQNAKLDPSPYSLSRCLDVNREGLILPSSFCLNTSEECSTHSRLCSTCSEQTKRDATQHLEGGNTPHIPLCFFAFRHNHKGQRQRQVTMPMTMTAENSAGVCRYFHCLLFLIFSLFLITYLQSTW
jgi:hypothetical protein